MDTLARPSPSRSIALDAAAAGERRLAAVGAAAWLGVLAVAGLGIALGLGPLSDAVIWAFVVMGVPSLATALILGGSSDGPNRRALLLVLWAVAGAVACGLGGGLSGPLTAWCLAPVAAATALGRRRLMAEAAALAVLGGALAAFAQAAGLEPPAPPEPLHLVLSLFALGSVGLALAAGLARFGRRRGVPEDARSDLEDLLLNQPHLILSLTGDGQVVRAYGSPPQGLTEAMLLKGLGGLVAPADLQALADALDSASRGGQSELVCAFAGDPERFIGLSLRSTRDGRLFCALRDASAQKAQETRLVEAKAAAEAQNSGKSRFLANMSHELRTPLNTIMGFSDIMKARLFGPLPAKYGEYADLIYDAGRHLLDLINDVLDVSKIEAERFQLQLEQLDARDPVSAALRLMRVQADEAGLSLRAALPADPIDITADPRALKQITLNLLSNALKFTPRGGQVTVTLQTRDDVMELTVADTGVGIAPDDVQRLGRPFEQAGDVNQRAKGTGLGLSLVRGLAELHGGQMVIQSTLGEGTSVTVRLPGVVQSLVNAGERPSAQVIAFNGGR
ncbi:MAG TPA: HAMP domain-containing sensor histidine kinase [Caulobacteraceae bacterium]